MKKTRKIVDNAPPVISRAALVRAEKLADRLIAWVDAPTDQDPLSRRVAPVIREEER